MEWIAELCVYNVCRNTSGEYVPLVIAASIVQWSLIMLGQAVKIFNAQKLPRTFFDSSLAKF
jgi:hypothetical protein